MCADLSSKLLLTAYVFNQVMINNIPAFGRHKEVSNTISNFKMDFK